MEVRTVPSFGFDTVETLKVGVVAEDIGAFVSKPLLQSIPFFKLNFIFAGGEITNVAYR